LMSVPDETTDEKVYESQKVTTTDATNALTIDTKNRISTRVAHSTPIWGYPCHPHSILRRLMPVPDETIDEKVYELQKSDDDRKVTCTYHRHKNPDRNTCRQPYANTKRSLSSSSNAASIDA
jgi:hypothetical protein